MRVAAAGAPESRTDSVSHPKRIVTMACHKGIPPPPMRQLGATVDMGALAGPPARLRRQYTPRVCYNDLRRLPHQSGGEPLLCFGRPLGSIVDRDGNSQTTRSRYANYPNVAAAMTARDVGSIGFIGAGALAQNLALALSNAGYAVTAIASRSTSSATALANALAPPAATAASPQQLAERCRLTFITTPDDAIAEVAASLRWRKGQLVAHCSGAKDLQCLAGARQQGASTGSLHPFQTFLRRPPEGLSAPQSAADAFQRFAGVTFAVEGDDGLATTLEAIATRFGGHAVRVAPELRPLYHAAATMSCGGIAALLNNAAHLWRLLGVDEADALRAMQPIVRSTIANVFANGPQAAATGPWVRGDAATVDEHLRSLQAAAPHLVAPYAALALSALPLSPASANVQGVRKIRQALQAALYSNSPGRQSSCAE